MAKKPKKAKPVVRKGVPSGSEYPQGKFGAGKLVDRGKKR